MLPRGEPGGGLHVLHGKCQFSPNLSNFNNINSVTIIILYLFQGASLGSEEASASATAGKGRAPFSRPPPHRRCNRKGFQVHLLINFARNGREYFCCWNTPLTFPVLLHIRTVVAAGLGKNFRENISLISLCTLCSITDCFISNVSKFTRYKYINFSGRGSAVPAASSDASAPAAAAARDPPPPQGNAAAAVPTATTLTAAAKIPESEAGKNYSEIYGYFIGREQERKETEVCHADERKMQTVLSDCQMINCTLYV